MDAETQKKLYAEAVGEDALARQEKIGEETFPCCWREKARGHASWCKMGQSEK